MDKEPYIHEIKLSTIGGTFSYDNEESLITHIFSNINLTKFTEGHLYVLYCYLDPYTNTIKLIITVYSKEQVYSDACHDFKPTARTAKHNDGATTILDECESIFFNELDLKDQETRKQLNTNLNKIYGGLLESDDLLLKGQVGGEDITNAFIQQINPRKLPNVSSIKLPESDLLDKGRKRYIRNNAIAALIAGTALSVAPKPPPVAHQLTNFSDPGVDEKEEAEEGLASMANPNHAHALHAEQEAMAKASLIDEIKAFLAMPDVAKQAAPIQTPEELATNYSGTNYSGYRDALFKRLQEIYKVTWPEKEGEDEEEEDTMAVDVTPLSPDSSPFAITAAKIPDKVLKQIADKVSISYDSGAPRISDEPSNPENLEAVKAFYEELKQISQMQAEVPAIPKAYDTGMPKPTNVQIGQVEEKIRIISFVRKEDKYYCQIIKPEIDDDNKLSCKTTFKEYNSADNTFQTTPDIESFKPNVAPLCKLVENKTLQPIYALMAKFIADRLLVLAFFLYYFTKSICPLTLLYTHDRRPFLDIIYSNVKDENYDDYHVLVPGVFWSAPSAGDALYLRLASRVNDTEQAAKIQKIIAETEAAAEEAKAEAEAAAKAEAAAAKAAKAKNTRLRNQAEAERAAAAAWVARVATAAAATKGRAERVVAREEAQKRERAPEKAERAAKARAAAAEAAEMDLVTQPGQVDAEAKTKRRRRRFKPKKIANQTIKQVKRISKRLKNKLIEKGRKTIKRFKKAKPETKKTRSKKINMYYKNTKPVKKIKNVRKFMKTLTPILFVKRLQNKATTRKNKTEQKRKIQKAKKKSKK